MTDRSPNPGHTGAYVIRLGWGLALLAVPGPILTAFRADDRRARITLRVLGARHVIQSLICGPRPSRAAARLAAVMDATHALTALGFAAIDPGRRRIATIDAAVAGTWATVDTHIVRND